MVKCRIPGIEGLDIKAKKYRTWVREGNKFSFVSTPFPFFILPYFKASQPEILYAAKRRKKREGPGLSKQVILSFRGPFMGREQGRAT